MARYKRCGDYKEALSAYLDGELSSAERIELLQHLSSCPDCRETLNEYRTIGTQLRGMPPLIVPEELTGSVYELTVDAPPRRLSLLTSRFGYPAAAAVAVLLIFVVATFLLVDGYRRGIEPAIEGSSPITGVQWSINDPIKITFNKEMNRNSVEAALTILPTSEIELDKTWDGNTLTIGGNRPLKPGSSYQVKITTDARDKWGNRLSEQFELSFATSSTLLAYETPVPVESEPTATVTPEVGVAHDEPLTATAVPPKASATTKTTDQASGEPPAQATETQPTNSPESETSNNEEPGKPDQKEQPGPPPLSGTTAPEPAGTPVPPTATPEPEPTEAPVESPPTETPEPMATEKPEPTESPATSTTEPEPEPTVTPETIPVVGSFGSVYWRNELVRNELGLAITHEHAIDAIELDFQRGKMFQEVGSDRIYMMLTEHGTWSHVPDTSGTDLPGFTEAGEAGTWEPGGVFGYLWHNEPYVQETLGYAVESAVHTFESSVQTFEGGTMLRGADGFIYILYDTTRWEIYPDAGSLSDTETTSEP